MRPNPRLIPRLDVEFGLEDLRLSWGDDEVSSEQVRSAMRNLFPAGEPFFVDSGRTALYLALRALGLDRGSRVGVPLFTCEAVFEAVVQAACSPVFLDIDPITYTLDPASLESRPDNLKAIVPIHTFGHPADMDAVIKSCAHAKVVEDCVHAVGSLYGGKPIGGFGDACFYSFRPGKPLSIGRLGMLITNDPQLLAKAVDLEGKLPSYSDYEQMVALLREFQRGVLYRRPWFGLLSLPVGSLMDEKLDFMGKRGFNPHRAAEGFLRVFVRRLRDYPSRLQKARENAKVLTEALAGTGVVPPTEASWGRHTYFQYAMRFPSSAARDRAVTHLAERGIDSIKFYHDSPEIAARYGYKRDCPVSESVADTILTVPCHGHLTEEELERISAALRGLGDLT